MAFKGDLKNISLFDVLQTLHQNKQSGVLVVQRDGITKKLHVDYDGVRVFFTRSFRPFRLGEIFIRRGRITTQDVEILLLQQKQSYRPMGELLVEGGKVTQEEVDAILHYHAEDEIYELFTWERGTFAFYDGQAVDESTTPLSGVLLDPAGLCLEAARRLDEMERTRQLIPDNDCYFVQVQDVAPDREQNSDVVCATFDTLAAPSSINDLRDLVGLSLYEALQAVSQLCDGGLVRGLSVDELVNAARAEHEAGDDGRAAGMLEKAHLLDPGNMAVLEECVSVVQRLGDPRRLSEHLGTLGRLYADAGRHEQAIELLEQALRQDSDNHETLNVLRDTFAELGDAGRSAEVSQRIARSFADDGNLHNAIDACRKGLELAAHSVSLRFYLCQLLARAELVPQAQQELIGLVRETQASARAMRSKKAHDLLTSCYRLLLRLNPEDEEAHKGLRDLDRRRMSTIRRKRFTVHGMIAAAVLAIVGVVGFTMTGNAPEELLEKVLAAYQQGDESALRELVGELLEKHPDSEETQQALAYRSEITRRHREEQAAKLEREKVIKKEFTEAWDVVRDALVKDESYLEALTLALPFLERLNKPHAKFLRPSMKAHFEYEFGAFLERVIKQFGIDRQQVALSENQLRKSVQTVESLIAIEATLARVRARNWSDLVPQMLEVADAIAAAPQAGKAAEYVAAFRKRIGDSYSSFSNLDTLYFTVRRKRLRLDITHAVAAAREQRLELLRFCRFDEARNLYDEAFRKAEAVTDERPREHFQELIKWLESTDTREDMGRKRDEIDHVVKTLKKIEVLRAEGRAAEAFLLFRPLVLEYRTIQFELKYKMPYQVRSTPTGAEIYIDDKLAGLTPLAIELDIVTRSEVVAKRAGFSDATTKLSATDPSLDGELVFELTKLTAWEKDIQGQVEAAPVLVRTKDRSLALVATSNAVLLAIDADNGDVVWAAPTGLLDRILARPTLDGDGHVFLVTVGGLLHRVRLSDGEMQRKKLQLPGQVKHNAAFDGKTLFVATGDRRLLAIRDMAIVFNKPLSLSPTTQLLHVGGKLFVGTAEGKILVHDAATGKQIRKLSTKSESSLLGGLAVYKDVVVASAEDGSLYAFKVETGDPAWQYPTAGPIRAAPATGKFIYLPARDGYVHAIDVEGQRQVRYQLDGAADHAPAMTEGFLYAVGGNKITAFETRNELPWWEYTFEDTDGAPEHVVAGNGVVIVITNRSQVVAFPLDKR